MNRNWNAAEKAANGDKPSMSFGPDPAQQKTGGTHARFLRKRRFKRRAKKPLANACPAGVARPAADAADRFQPRRAQFAKTAVGKRLDFSDALKHRLHEYGLVGRPRHEPGQKIRVVEGKAFTRPRQWIKVQACRLVRLQSSGKFAQIRVREKMLDPCAAGVRGAADQPAIA